MTGVRGYRKKPVVIEAMRFTGRNHEAVAEWSGLPDRGVNGQFLVETLEGVMTANSGDWIIRGVKGEFYPCKPDVFDATYEPAGVRVVDDKTWCSKPEPWWYLHESAEFVPLSRAVAAEQALRQARELIAELRAGLAAARTERDELCAVTERVIRQRDEAERGLAAAEQERDAARRCAASDARVRAAAMTARDRAFTDLAAARRDRDRLVAQVTTLTEELVAVRDVLGRGIPDKRKIATAMRLLNAAMPSLSDETGWEA